MSKNKKTEELSNVIYDPYKNKLCNKSMTFEECELAIVRNAIDENEKAQEELQKEKIHIDSSINRIFEVLETYIIKKKLLLYGGFAINAILPEYAKFYDAKHEIPDYDVYSPNSLEDAIELADFFIENGFKDVEAKAGVHFMTYKVYVNFIAVADLTILERSIFENLQKEAIIINRIHYCPVNFLRRNIYKELSQPQGNVSRWEKIYKRLNKINENYPLTVQMNCETVEFQRKMVSVKEEEPAVIYEVVKNAFIYLGAVFFGGFACSLYTQYMPAKNRRIIEQIPDFDVLYEDIEKAAQIVKEKLLLAGFKRVQVIYHDVIGEVIPESYEIKVNEDTVAFIYKPNACFSYNIVNLDKHQVKVASIDTMLFFCYSFYYSSQPYYFRERILCTIKILSDVEIQNRLNQKGLLKRFSTKCIGEHMNMMEMKEEKSKKFKELVMRRNTREYHEWFLKYNPLLHPRPAFMKKRRVRFERVRSSLKGRHLTRGAVHTTRRKQTRSIQDSLFLTPIIHDKRPYPVTVKQDATERESPVSIRAPYRRYPEDKKNTVSWSSLSVPKLSTQQQKYDSIEEMPQKMPIKRRHNKYDTIQSIPRESEDSRQYDTIEYYSPVIKETTSRDDMESVKKQYPRERKINMLNRGRKGKYK